MSAQELRRLLAEATPGPWKAADPPDGPGESMFWGADGWTVGNTMMWDNEEYIAACRAKGREPYDSLIIRRPRDSWRKDAVLIVAAVNALPALLDRIDELEAEVLRLSDEREALG